MLITLRKTKSRKQQIIPLSASLADILKEYMEIRGGDDDDFLFCDVCGHKATTHCYQTLVWRYNVGRGVNRTSIHAFRHTFAKRWITSGGDVVRLSKILGHSNISTTMQYLNLFSNDLQADFEKHCVVDQIREQNKRIHI
jgi:integrase/recombinase XerD